MPIVNGIVSLISFFQNVSEVPGRKKLGEKNHCQLYIWQNIKTRKELKETKHQEKSLSQLKMGIWDLTKISQKKICRG